MEKFNLLLTCLESCMAAGRTEHISLNTEILALLLELKNIFSFRKRKMATTVDLFPVLGVAYVVTNDWRLGMLVPIIKFIEVFTNCI